MPRTRPCSLLAKPVTHSAIVVDYLRQKAPSLAAELAWFAQRQANTAALERVTKARGKNGKRLPHQRRLLRTVSSQAFSSLSAILPRLMQAKNFSTLHTEIEKALGHIRGSGPLFVYDTSLRFGAFLNMFPQDVYLHAGAEKGAKRVLLRRPNPIEPVTNFPGAFAQLNACQIENLLCCYSECL